MRTTHLTSFPVHLTYRLYGSIPNLPLAKLQESYRFRKLQLDLQLNRAANLDERTRVKQQINSLEIDRFIRYDDLLDMSPYGPHYLKCAAAKKIILDSWQTLATLEPIHIYAISVMSNHVHVVLSSGGENTEVSLPDILARHKRFTARQLNKLDGTLGRNVWAEKEYCRTIRRGRFGQVLWYVLNNPVKAGLTDDPLGWIGNWFAPELYEGYLEPRVA